MFDVSLLYSCHNYRVIVLYHASMIWLRRTRHRIQSQLKDLHETCQAKLMPAENYSLHESVQIVTTSSAQYQDAEEKHILSLVAEVRKTASCLQNSVLEALFIGQVQQALQGLKHVSDLQGNSSSVQGILATQSPCPEQSVVRISKDSNDIFMGGHIRRLTRKATSRTKFTRSHRSSIQTILGQILCITNTYGVLSSSTEESSRICYQPEHESKTLLFFRPANWLLRLGVKYGLNLILHRLTQGWKNSATLSVFRSVPNDSLVFAFCKSGNLDGIRTLFSRGEASVWDQDSCYHTPLHVSVLLLTCVGSSA